MLWYVTVCYCMCFMFSRILMFCCSDWSSLFAILCWGNRFAVRKGLYLLYVKVFDSSFHWSLDSSDDISTEENTLIDSMSPWAYIEFQEPTRFERERFRFVIILVHLWLSVARSKRRPRARSNAQEMHWVTRDRPALRSSAIVRFSCPHGSLCGKLLTCL